ncbi:threonine aldolase [Macrolepiota fuliginosa MF-IS2]|uniref:Threonine aldolase n=1 Tax=Macrolepiota fuliginosa MF-IS2 TaxID=1400762 RepID=A0A9P5XI28_9AGAR|nr:threonine aldolase [Macrolepiota fuliginosa MF-IS2]
MSTEISPAVQQVIDQTRFDILSKTHAVDNASKREEIARTFISDTVTVPTEEMYTYATLATLGDDVYFEPSTAALEAHIAQLAGKEAALFMPSGTQSNQIALRTHLKQPPYSVVCDKRAHIFKYEAGGAAFNSNAHVVPITPANGHHLTLEEVQENVILGTDIHIAPTELVALENTLNGTIFPQDEIIKICDYAHSLGIKTHLDGARIWHVAIETGKSIRELCEPFDSVSVCFSKGLGAPIGSCLIGNKEFITRARWFRKILGGGMRQTGILAACAAYALTFNFPQLPRVHALTKKLEVGLEELGAIILSGAETCMLFYDPTPLGINFEEIGERAAALPEPLILGGSRLVVHVQTSEQAVDDFLSVIHQLAEEKKAAGWVQPANGHKTSAFKDVYVRRQVKLTK